MTARVFISYRSSDGADKATALARDLDAQGRRRIDRPDDPARTELAAGLAAGVHVVPLICDGVEALPDAVVLPPPFDQLADRTWRRLRAYDWKDDMARLAADLEALGVVPRAGPAADTGAAGPNAAAARPSRRGLTVAAGVLALAAAGGGGWLLQQRDRAADLSGRWEAHIGARGRRRPAAAHRCRSRSHSAAIPCA